MKTRKCPVCDWKVKDGGVKVASGGKTVVVCCDDCAEKVRENPAKFGEGKRPA